MASIMTYNNIFKLSNNTKDKDNKNKLKKIKEILNEMKLNLDFFFYKSTLISNLPSITKNGIILYNLYIYINTTFKYELRIFINKYIKIKYEIIELYKSIRNECIKFHKLSNGPNILNILNVRFESFKNALYRELNSQYKTDLKNGKIAKDTDYDNLFTVEKKNSFYREEEIPFPDNDLNDKSYIYKQKDNFSRNTKIINSLYKKALLSIKEKTKGENLKTAIDNMIKMEEVYRIFMVYSCINIRLNSSVFKQIVYNRIKATNVIINEKITDIEKNVNTFNIKIKNLLDTYINNILQYYDSNYKDTFAKIIYDIFLLDIESFTDKNKTTKKTTKSDKNEYLKLFNKNININLKIPRELELQIKSYDWKIFIEGLLLQGPNDIIKYDKNLIYISFNKIFDKLKFKILSYEYDILNIIEYFKILNIFYSKSKSKSKSKSEYIYDIKNYYNILFVLITNILLTFSEIINILLYYLDNITKYYPITKDIFKIKYKFGPIYIINNNNSEKDYINNDEFLQCDKDNSHNYEKDDYVNYDTDGVIDITELIEDSEEDKNEHDYIFYNKDINKIFNELLCIFIIPRLLLINSIYKKEPIKIKLYYFSHFKC